MPPYYTLDDYDSLILFETLFDFYNEDNNYILL